MQKKYIKWIRLYAVVLAAVIFVENLSFHATAIDTGISAESAIVIEAVTGEILFEKNAYEERPMASTTKIMTTLLCLESGDLDTVFEVDSDAIQVEGSSMGLVEHDLVTKRALCYGMLLPSGNDAAGAVAVRLAGSYTAFADMMNDKATQLGLEHMYFVTPSGLHDEAHYSTAYDMALLTAYALQNDTFREICCQSEAKVCFGNPPYERWLQNSNKLLQIDDSIIGVKTGFTDEAGRCLVSAAQRDGVTLICVTLNDTNDWQDHLNLYDTCFAAIVPITLEKENWTIPVVGGRNGSKFDDWKYGWYDTEFGVFDYGNSISLCASGKWCTGRHLDNAA
ncbi:MAG: D-alanyl-D-alanine carboxypeptidase [Ruminococcus sp.]|nr:D-alanyl-D-alanine carboxypeptidase [Ruminococcus sp.]